MTESTNPQTDQARPEQTSSRCGRDATDAFSRAFRMPEEAGEHFRQARIEFLKGIREIVDQKIQKLSNPSRRGTRVTVE